MHGLEDRLVVWDTHGSQQSCWAAAEPGATAPCRDIWEAVSSWLKLSSELSKSCCFPERQRTSHQPTSCGTLLPWEAGLPGSRQVSFLRREQLLSSRPAVEPSLS